MTPNYQAYQPKLQLTSLLISQIYLTDWFLSIHTNGSSMMAFSWILAFLFTIRKSESFGHHMKSWLPNATNYQVLSTHSFSAAILPELRPPIFPNVPTAEDKPLKLLLPSLKFRDFLDFLNLEELKSPMSQSVSS